MGNYPARERKTIMPIVSIEIDLPEYVISEIREAPVWHIQEGNKQSDVIQLSTGSVNTIIRIVSIAIKESLSNGEVCNE